MKPCLFLLAILLTGCKSKELVTIGYSDTVNFTTYITPGIITDSIVVGTCHFWNMHTSDSMVYTDTIAGTMFVITKPDVANFVITHKTTPKPVFIDTTIIVKGIVQTQVTCQDKPVKNAWLKKLKRIPTSLFLLIVLIMAIGLLRR